MQFTLRQACAILAFASLASAQSPTPTSCTTAAVSPSPFTYVCNKQGRLQNPAVISSGSSPDQVTCRGRCLNNQPQCISFSYGPGQQCRTYNQKIIKSGFTKANTGRTFWNRNCYKVTCGLCADDGTEPCNGFCVDKQTSNTDCGTCGNACSPDTLGTTCQAGACKCEDGTTPDFQNDNANCGSCGNNCGSFGTCSSGTCTPIPFYLVGSASGTSADGQYATSSDNPPQSAVGFYQPAPFSVRPFTIDPSTGQVSDASGLVFARRRRIRTNGGLFLYDPADNENGIDILSCSISEDDNHLSCRDGDTDLTFGLGDYRKARPQFYITVDNGDTAVTLTATVTPPP